MPMCFDNILRKNKCVDMKAPKIMIALIVAALVLSALKLLLMVPGMGFLATIGNSLISLLVILVPLIGLIKLSTSKSTAALTETDDVEMVQKVRSYKKKVYIFLSILGFCLSMTILGGLFRLMHWPGGGFISGVGLIPLIAVSIALFIYALKNRDKVDLPWGSVMGLSILSIVSMSLVCSGYFTYAGEMFAYRNCPTIQECISDAFHEGSQENGARRNLEVFKYRQLGEANYNRMAEKEKRAMELADGNDSALVLYVSSMYAPRDYRVFLIDQFYDRQVTLSEYVKKHVEENSQLYVVTDETGVDEALTDLGVSEDRIHIVE